MGDTTTLHNAEWRTQEPGMAPRKVIVTEGPSGFSVYRSPEFQALCKLIGVDWEACTVDIEIRLTEERTVAIQTVHDKG